MKSMVSWSCLLALTVCALLPFPAVAQTTGPEPPFRSSREPTQNSSKPIQMDVSLVLVNMTVTDPNDRLVTGLEKENFRVFEDGKERKIVTFSSEDVPISVRLENKIECLRFGARDGDFLGLFAIDLVPRGYGVFPRRQILERECAVLI